MNMEYHPNHRVVCYWAGNGKKMLMCVYEDVIRTPKLCSHCFTKAGKLGFKGRSTSEDSESSASPVAKDLQSAILITEKEASTANLDNSFALLNKCPPAPLHNIPKCQKIKVCEQKMEKVKRKLTSQLAASSGLDDNEFDISNKHVLELKKKVDELQNDSTHLHCIMAKFLSTDNFSDKLQILILVPQSWSAEKACMQFTTPEGLKKKKEANMRESKEQEFQVIPNKKYWIFMKMIKHLGFYLA